MGRTVLFHRHDPPLYLEAQVRGADLRMLLVKRVIVPVAPRGPRTRHLFVDADVPDFATFDSFHATIDVGYDANGERHAGHSLLSNLWIERRDTQRRHGTCLERNGRPAACPFRAE